MLTLLLAAAMLASPTENPIQKLTPEAERIFAPGAQLEQIASGYTWTEGPVWIPHGGYLLFAEITSNSIRKWVPNDGPPTIFLQPSGYQLPVPYGGKEPGSNGMTLDPLGRLSIAGHARRNVWRLETMDPHGPHTVLADSYQGKKLNSPNDLVYKSDGSLYFTDPPYGLPTQSDSDPRKELSFNGVYRIPNAVKLAPASKPQEPQLLIKDLPRPNGLAFSPDEKFLYVANSEPKLWMRYDVAPDGSVANGKLWVDAKSNQTPGAPDGIKIDREGHIYAAAPGGIWILMPDGTHVATIAFPFPAANLNWGDADRKTLYITASGTVARIRLLIAGQ